MDKEIRLKQKTEGILLFLLTTIISTALSQNLIEARPAVGMSQLLIASEISYLSSQQQVLTPLVFQTKYPILKLSSEPRSYKRTASLFVGLTVPLVVGSLIANKTERRGLAGDLAIGAIVTSSLGLYFTIKDSRERKRSAQIEQR